MSPIRMVMMVALAFAILVLAALFALIAGIGRGVAEWWIRRTGGDEPIGPAAREPGEEILAVAYHPDDPGFGCHAVRGELTARDTPEGRAIEMVWRCGVRDCPGHASPEGASVHHDLCGEGLFP